MAKNGQRLGELLMEADVITKRQLAKAIQKQVQGDDRKLGDILIDLGQKWNQATNGEVQVRIYPGGILGDERDMVRKMRIGQIQAAALSTEGLSELAPEFSAFFLPLAYQDFDDINNVLADLLPDLSKEMENDGVKLLYVSDLSWAYWFSTEPIRVPGDLKGKKILTFSVGVHVCIGRELAKLEARVTLNALRKRYPKLILVNEGERVGPFMFWGRSKLPVKHHV